MNWHSASGTTRVRGETPCWLRLVLMVPRRCSGASGFGLAAPVSTSGSENLGLLRLELGVREDALVLEFGELLQLRHHVGRDRALRLGRGRRRSVLLLLGLLVGPAIGLAA